MTHTNPGVPSTWEQALQYYQQKYESQLQILQNLAGRWSWFSYLRGGSFLLALLLLFLGLGNAGGVNWPWWVLAGLTLIGFLVIAYIHEGMQSQMNRARLLVNLHRESIARIKRDWPNIQVPGYEVASDRKSIAFDLDLTGGSSLYKLLGTARTPLGIQQLGDWMTAETPTDEIADRQVGVRELAPHFSYREHFQLLCAELHASQSGPNRFIEWAESPHWFAGRRWLLWLSRLTALATILAIVASFFVSLEFTGPVILVTLVVNFFLSVFFAGSMHDVFNQISSHQNEISHYVSLFEMVNEFECESPYLNRIQQDLSMSGDDVRRHVGTLSLLTWLANLRRNGIFFLAYLLFEFLVFWDAHVLNSLENWKAKHGHKAKRWFAALGRWEAMLALSKLAADNPEWTFPEVKNFQADAIRVQATGLGHPLLDASRVSNDVMVGPPGTVLLVTGSNMSGKSTLLRSIGVNVTLAQMGSVVCADAMTLSPLRIETSMRIVDSLSDGVSFFMAELKRLKEVVDIAGRQKESGDRTLLFLLDEILQGTNSRERHIAVSRVVRRLIDQQAIGAISTHDLDLAVTEELSEACCPVHFSESFVEKDGRSLMTFDYQMRQGIAETTNALKLLEMVGLGEQEVSGNGEPTRSRATDD